MQFDQSYEPEFDSLKRLLLDMAQERSVEKLMNMIVHRLAHRPHLALARLWLKQAGDICPSCPKKEECPSQESCLHLIASAGNPLTEKEGSWSRIDGPFRRIPLWVGTIGRIGGSGETVITPHIQQDSAWKICHDWARREKIIGFLGHPVIHKSRVLGVLAIFTRIPTSLDGEGQVWLRMLADHAASAIANARAFEEIERLRRQLEMENAYLNEEVLRSQFYGDIIGNSPALRTVMRQIEMVAPTDASALIVGESGTGKELVAREIHRNSRRGKRPMIKVNCASIPRELYESEFFGHVKGAYTGAVKDRAGRFELADGGTLFLDEVGEIPLELQSKLLRVLQEGTFERVGEEHTRQVNVRVIAATNRDLKREVETGRFRKDLYYRLNVFPIEVPPLRTRKEDIPPLASHFLDIAARKLNRPKPRLTQAALLRLQRYSWPGNARELQNVIERAIITSQSGKLNFDLPLEEPSQEKRPTLPATAKPDSRNAPFTDAELKHLERENTLLALRLCGGKIHGPGGAAELLGMKPTTLSSRIRKLGLKVSG